MASKEAPVLRSCDLPRRRNGWSEDSWWKKKIRTEWEWESWSRNGHGHLPFKVTHKVFRPRTQYTTSKPLGIHLSFTINQISRYGIWSCHWDGVTFVRAFLLSSVDEATSRLQRASATIRRLLYGGARARENRLTHFLRAALGEGLFQPAKPSGETQDAAPSHMVWCVLIVPSRNISFHFSFHFANSHLLSTMVLVFPRITCLSQLPKNSTTYSCQISIIAEEFPVTVSESPSMYHFSDVTGLFCSRDISSYCNPPSD